MNRKIIAVSICIGTIAMTAPALARGMQDVQADYRSWGTPHASAGLSGTQEKTVLHKQSSGHYSVCNHGSHPFTVSYDGSAALVHHGDCMAVEAKKITVKGSEDTSFNRAFIYNHTHYHSHGR